MAELQLIVLITHKKKTIYKRDVWHLDEGANKLQ